MKPFCLLLFSDVNSRYQNAPSHVQNSSNEMTSPTNGRRLSRKQLRKTITNMVVEIETVMSSINIVLGEVRDLVHQIDTITEKLEGKHENRLKATDPYLHLDANRNVCEFKQGQYLHESVPGKDIYKRHHQSHVAGISEFDMIAWDFTYNDKYPLWIQSDTWKTTSISELSVVSTGSNSDVNSDTDETSWVNVSNLALFGNEEQQRLLDNQVQRLCKCCVNKSDSNCVADDIYCGVYETIMEEMLEEPKEILWYKTDDSFNTSTDFDSRTTVSISDENFINFNKSSTKVT